MINRGSRSEPGVPWVPLHIQIRRIRLHSKRVPNSRFLNYGIMHEYIFTRTALDEAIALLRPLNHLTVPFSFTTYSFHILQRNSIHRPGTRNTVQLPVAA